MATLFLAICLILIGIAMIHPVFFMLIDSQVQQGNIRRRTLQYNYLIHIIAGAISVLFYWIFSLGYTIQIAATVYLLVIITIVFFYWNTGLTKWNLFSASILFGFIVYFRSINEIVEITPIWPGLFTGLIGSGVLSVQIIIFLNVFFKNKNKVDEALQHRLIRFLFILLGIRIIWDFVILFNLSVATQYGETISALRFFWQTDATKLTMFLVFGIFAPLLYLLLHKKILFGSKHKNKLFSIFVFFISLLTAEFITKHFLLQFGIVL
jgi:hypothetical protein